MSRSDRFLRACLRKVVDRTPVWLMRQAGRYMPDYRKLREKYGILEIIKNPDLAADVTLQPVEAFQVDAAIIFSDILPVLEPMGLKLDYLKGEGPVIHNPVCTEADVKGLRVCPPEEGNWFTLNAIQQVRERLAGKVPLIGFSGAPFTLVSYAVEGGASRNYAKVKGLMYEQPVVWHGLMDKMTRVVEDYLQAQVKAGVQALQLFDTWAGTLSPSDYQEYVLPYSQRVIEYVKSLTEVPLIHFGTGTSGMLSLIREAGGDVIGVDWRIDLVEAWKRLGEDVAVQGNLDPVILFAPISEIQKQVSRILDSVRGRPGHVFNLGHGVLPFTPVDHVRALVDFVHEYTGCVSDEC